MENILNQIITKKKEKIIDYKKKYPMNNLLDNIKNINTFVDFISKIKKRSIGYSFFIIRIYYSIFLGTLSAHSGQFLLALKFKSLDFSRA